MYYLDYIAQILRRHHWPHLTQPSLWPRAPRLDDLAADRLSR